ncbi:MAG: DUF4358 domain-containing protein [Clostridia bacterium]|nr:DUF4358 domain-containing protein [Clostridia bacterium]
MKKILALLLAVITVFSLTACGGDKYADLNIGSITGFGQNILTRSKFEFNLSEVDADDLEFSAETLLKISKDKINYINGKPEMYRAMASPEEILIIGATDAAAAKAIINGPIADWVKYERDGYSDYGPEQVPKIDSCVKTTAGRYVFLIISNDNEQSRNVLNDLLETALKIHD